MPEVLPAPTVMSARDGESDERTRPDVRGRTVAHMQRLLAVAAVPLASCTRSDTQTTQTVTIPVSSSSGAPQDSAQGSLLPTMTASATATVTKPPDDMQYMVVDPMPTPARCMGLASATQANATFKHDAGGVYLDIKVSLPTGAAWAGTTFASGSPPSPWSGTLIGSNVSSTTASARVRPSAGVTSLGVSFTITCPAGPGSLAITASFTSSPTDATKATLQKTDY
jgi:hypothetical protein